MGRYGGHECGKCGGSHRGTCPAYYDAAEHLQDQMPQEESGCSKCGTFSDVHECHHCGVVLCIDCDPDEMRSDHDDHTYCHQHGPDSCED